MTDTPTNLSDYFSAIGQRGGKVRSERKKRSGQRNTAKAREAKAMKRGQPLMGRVEPQKRATGGWPGAVRLYDLRAMADSTERSDLKVQQTGRRRG